MVARTTYCSIDPERLGTVVPSWRYVDGGWITPDGSIVRIGQTHIISLANALGLHPSQAQPIKRVLGAEHGLIRYRLQRQGIPGIEIYTEPTPAQIQAIMRISSDTGTQPIYAIVNPDTGDTLAEGFGEFALINDLKRIYKH